LDEEKKSISKGRVAFLVLFMIAIGLVFGARLTRWQLLEGSKWLETANNSSDDKVTMEASRGEIIDINGVGLAVNQTGYAITFNGATMTTKTKNSTILKLIKLLNSRGEKWTDELPITVNSKGQYEFIAGRDEDVSYLKSKSFLSLQSYATAEQCMDALIEKYDCKGYSAKETRDIISVRYNMTKTGFSISTPYTFADSVSQDTIAIISENSSEMPGVEAKVTTIRKYPDGAIMPQILGTIGAIPAKELQSYLDKGYAMNARVGTSGVEKVFENWLCGKAGQKTVTLDANGEFVSEIVTKQPTPGNTVQLSIDSNMQRVINASLAKNVKGAQEYGKKYGSAENPMGADCTEGAAVVLRVKDFAILAASTYPSYDQNKLASDSAYYSRLLQDNTKPLINRAFNGVFTPGSSFKPAVALAALQEGTISNSTVFGCYGVYDLSDLHLHCWSRGGHGPLDLKGAIARSCNVYFCNVGYRTGISAIDLYANRLGLGVETGVEIGESVGVVAGPEERKAAGGSTWNAGDTVQASIGQSDNQVTPLQLATYCATIANNGVRLKTHIVEKIVDYSRTNTVYTTPVTKVTEAGISQTNINYVKAGMRACTQPGGTGAGTFGNYGVAVAAKTGTAQTGTGHSDNEVFIGFAPYEKPEIAVAVILPHGGTSTYSLAVAKDIFDSYFYGKTVDEKGNIVMPSQQASSAASSASSAAASSASASR
jgi:penicillin-binding protein 2